MSAETIFRVKVKKSYTEAIEVQAATCSEACDKAIIMEGVVDVLDAMWFDAEGNDYEPLPGNN